ncbi:MAG: DNA translocase FtsK 4TM domain-containing protein [Holosporaceae bacterium]|jgi:S-DNA-T family DNA segregation ATPase FtsK/SpoIIIE|nr:DNA translocase FtsK 4TM domain-containing protein [Holosporaceae bacterium]
MYKNDRYAFRNFLSGLYTGFIEIFGIFLFFVAMATVASLISYSPDDPSLNTAINASPSNLLSLAGSYYSDVMVQIFGASSYLFSAILLSFGYQLMKYHAVQFFRILACFVACISAAFMASIWNVKWFGAGIVGNLLIEATRTKIDLSIPTNFWLLVGIVAFTLATATILAMRLNFSHFKELCESFLGGDGDFSDDALEVADSLESLETSESSLIKKRAMGAKTGSHLKANREDMFVLPPVSMLREVQSRSEKLSESELKARSDNLLAVLNDFGVKGEITGVNPGPVVTLYELKPAAGIKSSRVIGLSSDIARYMSAVSARVAVIPGKNALGIELPNLKRQTVYLREILESDAYGKSAATLPITLGKDISGEPIVADLARMPHLLIAGTTGSGKSVGINAMILSLLYKLSPSECKFIMIDPKMLELSVYDDIPHLLTPVVTDPKKAVVALKWAVREMESRYMAMSKLGVRNIDGYNAKLESLRNSGESLTRRIHTGFDQETGAPIYETQTVQMEAIPYIVIIVDEMADLMLVAGKDIEVAVQRLAQMARAAGIHLVMATQRPSVDVITGTIKANFPTRISFQVSSKIDSRTILGEQGAEQLLGQGDMLYMASGGRMIRIHCPFVSDGEVEKVTENLKAQGEPHYISTILEENDCEEGDDSSAIPSGDDPLYGEAVSLILREGKASTSFIQRHLKIGYNRAARIIDMMETAGIVSQPNHVGKREILGK